MSNETKLSDHGLTSYSDRRRVRKLIHGPCNSWLAKRRDGMSPRWQIAWYDPSVGTIRYRSTRTIVLAEAKEALRKFQLPENAESASLQKPSKRTQVYFIGGETGPIKIGIAQNVARRLSTLQSFSPVKLSVLASGWGTLKDERILHDRFAAHRLHGEWFERHPDILAEVERLSPHTPRGVSLT